LFEFFEPNREDYTRALPRGKSTIETRGAAQLCARLKAARSNPITDLPFLSARRAKT